jgi:hypothetical protein
MLAAIVSLALAPAAHAALDPPQAAVGGASSKWISGSLLSQTGLNCSTAIIGNAYTEIMVSGIASYGGAPNGGVPRVNDPYWTAMLVSIPGNPCGSGSSSVVTTLIMPPNTNFDSSRQIRCFGLGRSAGATWQEITGQSWSFLGSSGPYCPTQPSISPYHQGGLQMGFRPLANGQMFWIFVPVKSTGTLVGAAGPSPGHGFTWMTDATGVYANPGRSFVWANVFNSSAGTNPFIFFSREPAAVPFWKNGAPAGTENRVEFFADLYSDFRPGTLCFTLYAGTTATGTPLASCTDATGWNGAVSNAADLWQVFGTGDSLGPNGGYVPFAYPANTTYTLRWTFAYSGGTAVKDVTFTTLAGPDQDGDGVPNNGTDLCPADKGTLANGCLPAVQADPDQDGVYGPADLCPNTAGNGALNGCPDGIVPDIKPPDPGPGPDPVIKTLVGTILVKKGAALNKGVLAKGAPVKFECTVDSAASGTLSIAAKAAKKLGIKLKKKQKNVTIAKGAGQCKAGSPSSLKLKLARAYAKKVKRARKAFAAALAVKLTAPGQAPVTMKQGVKVR